MTPWSYPRSKKPWQQHATRKEADQHDLRMFRLSTYYNSRDVPVIAQTRYFPRNGTIHIVESKVKMTIRTRIAYPCILNVLWTTLSGEPIRNHPQLTGHDVLKIQIAEVPGMADRMSHIQPCNKQRTEMYCDSLLMGVGSMVGHKKAMWQTRGSRSTVGVSQNAAWT